MAIEPIAWHRRRMLPWEFDTDRLTWEIPLLGADAPSDLPEHWTAAVAAVGHDLMCSRWRYGKTVELNNVVWQLILSSRYHIDIGIKVMDDNANIGTFSDGQDFEFDTTTAQATIWVADTLQTQLAGSEFIQWPSDGWHLLAPTIRAGIAVWIHPATNDVVTRIGALSEEDLD